MASAIPGDLVLNGNIGSGKSSLGRRLASEHGYVFFDEPTDEWTYLLTRIYKHGDVYLTPLFQAKVMCYYAKVTEEILRLSDKPGGRTQPVVVTRSPRSTLLFIEANQATFTRRFHRALKDFVEMLESKFPFWLAARNICLYQTAESCFANMNHRGDVEQDVVPLSYLQKLDALHMTYAEVHRWEFIHATDLDVALSTLLKGPPAHINARFLGVGAGMHIDV